MRAISPLTKNASNKFCKLFQESILVRLTCFTAKIVLLLHFTP